MPRKSKVMPVERSEWTFGDALYWHFFIYGTRPDGDPAARAGAVWQLKRAAAELRITTRTFWNWIEDRHPPYDTVAIERVLFGTSRLHDDARAELRRLLSDARQPKPMTQTGTARGIVPVVSGQAVVVYETPFDEADIDGPSDQAAERPGTALAAAEKFGNLAKNVFERSYSGRKLPVWLGGTNGTGRPTRARRRIIGAVAVALCLLVAFEFGKRSDTPTAAVPAGPAAKPSEPPIAEVPKGSTNEEQRRAAERRRADEEAARKKAAEDRAAREAEERERLAQTARAAAEERARPGDKATMDSIARKKAEEEVAAATINRKLQALEAAQVDVCKKQLEGISVPGFTLKCNTLIPFGKLLQGVGVSQTASSLSDCAARCRRARDCVAFSFDAGAHTGAASCYLTGSIPSYNNATNWISGVR